MGNLPTQLSTNQSQNIKFLNKIQKVSNSYSEQFGNYNIYQLQQKPYDYYLEYIQTSIPQSDSLKQKLIFYQNMPKNKNLVPIQYAEIVKKKQLCAQFDGLRVFCMYYNFTLQDAIRLKIKQKVSFTEGQIVYILRSLLSIGKFYQTQLKASYYSGIYQSKKIFVSPQGHIKIYPFNQNLFTAYSDFQLKQEQSVQSVNIQSKKISIELNNTLKPIGQVKNEYGYVKNSMSNSRCGMKKSKLTTTLGKQYLSGINSQQSLHIGNQIVNNDKRIISRLKGLLQKQQNSQSMSYLYHNKQQTNKQDLFELGLLMMQLILLNQSHQYYISKQLSSSTSSSSNNISNSHYGIHSKNDHTNHIKQNNKYKNDINLNQYKFKKLQQYQNSNGKIPNIDLIYFSLNKLIPKKNISKPLINIIDQIIFNTDNNSINIQDLYSTIQRFQQLSTQPKYCIKFDVIKQQPINQSDLHVSKYLMKNKSIDPFVRTTDLSYALGSIQSANQSKILPRKYLQPAMSKQSFFTTNKLQDLIQQGNLTNSMIAQGQDSTNSSVVLSNLKKSRKLVPSKLRSISIKLSQKPVQKQEQSNIKRQRLKLI